MTPRLPIATLVELALTARSAALVPAAVLALVASAGSTVRADPRWWWDERPLGSGAVVDVDVAALPGWPETPAAHPMAFVAWVEPESLIEAWLRLTASFDGGCTTCEPVVVLGAIGTADEIALAAVETPSPVFESRRFSVAVLQAGDGRLRVAHGTLDVATLAPPALWCEELRAIRWEVTTLSDGGASSPDVAAASVLVTGLAHFHATWRQEIPTRESDAFHARDLVGDGTDWEVTGALPEPAGGALDVADPRVAVDLVGDATRSSVEVVHGDPLSGAILRLRSTDSGTTFSASGESIPSEPEVINAPGTGAAPIALDSGTTGGPEPAWHAAAWLQDIGGSVGIVLDGAFQVEPTRTDPTWGPEHFLTGTGFAWDVELALSVGPGGGDGPAADPAPALLFWNDPAGEIAWRGGLLDAGAAEPVDVDGLPFPRGRASDPTISANAQLSACAFDHATGGCVPTRLAGSARQPATDEADGVVFVAWIDDREGFPSVWLTRSDAAVDPPVPALTAECSATQPGRARVTVSFSPLSTCSSVPVPTPERIRRYLLYHGSDPGGPYENTDLDGTDPLVRDTIVVVDDGSLGDPVTVVIDDLAPSTTHWIVVVPEDEARNVSPLFFDPLADGAGPFANQASVTTPACGSPGRCLYRATSASLDAWSLFAGSRDPANDVAFAPPFDAPHSCPFASGDADPDPVLAPGAPPLVFYQVEGADLTGIRLSRDAALQSVRIEY